ncbi:CueP family metal-binding protein [Leucobacter sp. UCMA 4100]|uniref:CueP family metal-binding protein n=1 Tax=Leucobacter sp. UCMA 4100 TaxID=2810534 RepID=UPI0022EAB805|nr:CueP family metal-binding protein [Leucobacter sp. UCMA 4100]MDA3146747.1 CueP family metal-binding protein [Leucobacter sp. UCMA 4100]
MTVTSAGRIKLRTAAVIAALALALSGCAAGGEAGEGPSPQAVAELETFGLERLDARETITRLDAMTVADRPENLFASITPAELQLTVAAGEPGEEVVVLPMPDDAFYVSIAPFATQTHECFYHSLTTCLGEFGNLDVDVTVTDRETGKVVEQTRLTTFDNGFLGLWLSRGSSYEVSMTSEKGAGKIIVETDDDDPTCITTLQLS